jgi:hypothetical protein
MSDSPGQNVPVPGDEDRFFDSPAGAVHDDQKSADADTTAESDPMGVGSRLEAKKRSRKIRTRFLIGLFIALSLVLGVLLFDGLLFFFRSSTPLDLGQAEDLQLVKLPNNSYIRVQGIARDLCIRADVLSSKVRFLYLLGSEMGGRILLELPSDGAEGCLGAEDRIFEGRIIDLSTTKRFNEVIKYYQGHFPSATKDGPMYMVLVDEKPGQDWWIPASYLMLLIMVLINLRMAWRMERHAFNPPGEKR